MLSFIKNIRPEYRITTDDIKNIENKFDIVFPEILSEFLLANNGAEIILSEIVNSGIRYEVASLVPVLHGRLSVEKIMEWDKLDAIIKNGLVPIASDRGGNIYYCDSVCGDIVLYFADDIENPRQVSKSFQDFLVGLTPIKNK